MNMKSINCAIIFLSIGCSLLPFAVSQEDISKDVSSASGGGASGGDLAPPIIPGGGDAFEVFIPHCTEKELEQFSEEYDICHSKAVGMINQEDQQASDLRAGHLSPKHKEAICRAFRTMIEECTQILSWCFTPTQIRTTKQLQRKLFETSLSQLMPDFDLTRDCGDVIGDVDDIDGGDGDGHEGQVVKTIRISDLDQYVKERNITKEEFFNEFSAITTAAPESKVDDDDDDDDDVGNAEPEAEDEDDDDDHKHHQHQPPPVVRTAGRPLIQEKEGEKKGNSAGHNCQNIPLLIFAFLLLSMRPKT